MITLLHPSRGRHLKAFQTLSYWLQKSSKTIGIEHIVSVDKDDPERMKYHRGFPNSTVVSAENSCVVEATNRAAKMAKGDILIYLSDDFKCPENWDILISEKVKGKTREPWLLKVDDCLQKFHVPVLTIPVMSRELYEKLGYFWHPGYRSMFVDEDLFWVCKNNNWIVEAPELKFPHEHCSIGKADNDETYRRSAANWDQGKSVFAKRKAEGFPV